MKRDLAALANSHFDVLIIGGGIFGACAAWDAAQRGLSVAIIDRADFGAATSANSFKIIHGGIRYVQHGDLYRIRQSSQERRTWLEIAPHLVRPLPIVIPTYGHAAKGKLALRLAAIFYDGLTADRNFGLRDPQRRIPLTRFLSRQRVLEMFPALPQRGLTGAAIFHDAQIHNPPRLVLAFLQRATEAGAVAANYLQATGFKRQGHRIGAVCVRDALSHSEFEIRAHVVLNAAGPYAEHLLQQLLGEPLRPRGAYSRDACFVVPQRLLGNCPALAVLGRTRDPDAWLSRGRRHLFLVPWRNYTLVGVWHKVYAGDPDRVTVAESELEAFVDEINEAYPALKLTIGDISICNTGLVPFGENEPGAKHLRYGHRSRLVDHAQSHGIDNLLTLIGVRFTAGRYEAVRAVNCVFRKLDRKPPRSRTRLSPVWGGELENLSDYREQAVVRHREEFDSNVISSLVDHYGSHYMSVVELAAGDASLRERLGDSQNIEAQVCYAVRQEMAQTLADVVFRRTDLATGTFPGHSALRRCADRLANELAWSPQRTDREVDEVMARFPAHVVQRLHQVNHRSNRDTATQVLQ